MGDDANSAFISYTNPCLLCALAGEDELVAGCAGATEMRAAFMNPPLALIGLIPYRHPVLPGIPSILPL
jgi:hypothetical protein